MADQCIICLDDLDAVIPDEITLNSPHTHDDDFASTSVDDQSVESVPLSIAVIQPCNHILHDSCLQTWSLKANSCPICRQNYNEVEVYDKVGG